MRDKNRIKPFLGKLEELWMKYPDLRFGQLIAVIAGEMKITDIFTPEDEVWLEGIQRFIDRTNNQKEHK